MKYLLSHLLVLTCLPCFAQVDSLKALLRDKPKNEETVKWINLAVGDYWQTDPEAMEEMGKIALEMAKEINFPEGIARSHNSIGISLWSRDLYDLAMEHYLESLRVFQEIGNLNGAAILSINIGTIYDELKQIENAKKYTTIGLTYFEQLDDSLYISRSQLNLGVIYFNLEQYDSALFFFDKVEAYRRQIGDTLGLAIVYNNIAAVQQSIDDLDKSIRYYQLAQSITTKDQKNLLSDIYGGLTYNYLMTGKVDLGMNYADSALLLADEVGQKQLKQNTYSHLKKYYVMIGQYDKAFDYLEKEYALDQEIRGEDVQARIEKLTAQYESEKREKQMAILEKEKSQSEFYFITTLGSGIFLVIAAGLIIYTLRLRIRNSRFKEAELRSQLEQKNKELTSYALNFIQKNELMGELTDRINELKKQSDPGTISELNRINNIVDSSFRIDQDWENFKMMFEEVHQGFLPSLKEVYAELSNADLKLCALLRLNLNLKESSKILGISPDSVKIARYRLRKKLKLSTEDNLIDFLILFDKKRSQQEVA